MPRSNCRLRTARRRVPKTAGYRRPRIRSASRSLGVLREQRRARRRPGARARHRAGARGRRASRYAADDRATSAARRPPTPRGPPRAPTTTRRRAASATKRAARRRRSPSPCGTPGADVGWGSSRRRSERPRSVSAEPACSKGLERSRPDVRRRVARQLRCNVSALRELDNRATQRDDAEANEVARMPSSGTSRRPGTRRKPVELGSDPNRLASVARASIRAVERPLVIAWPSRLRVVIAAMRISRSALRSPCSRSRRDAPSPSTSGTNGRGESSGRARRSRDRLAAGSERSRRDADDRDGTASSSQPPHAIAQITASVAASTVPRYRHPARVRAHPSGGGPDPATSQRARRSGRSGATPSPSARRRPTRARGGRRRRPADRSR